MYESHRRSLVTRFGSSKESVLVIYVPTLHGTKGMRRNVRAISEGGSTARHALQLHNVDGKLRTVCDGLPFFGRDIGHHAEVQVCQVALGGAEEVAAMRVSVEEACHG